MVEWESEIDDRDSSADRPPACRSTARAARPARNTGRPGMLEAAGDEEASLDVAEAHARLRVSTSAVLGPSTSELGVHLVSVVYTLVGDDRIVIAVDSKPKRSRRLRWLANIRADPRVSLLVDEYGEDSASPVVGTGRRSTSVRDRIESPVKTPTAHATLNSPATHSAHGSTSRSNRRSAGRHLRHPGDPRSDQSELDRQPATPSWYDH